MRMLDRMLGGLLVLLGCVHNFIAAPMAYERLTTAALWFIAGGLVLWYSGFINLLRSYARGRDAPLAWLCVLTNLSLLVFVVTYASLRGNWATPEALLLIGSVTVLTGMSCRYLVHRSGTAPKVSAS